MSKSGVGIVLASASPRRKQLLTEAGYEFEIWPSEIDEPVFLTDGISAREFAETAALAKARSVAERFAESLVIGADTVVDFGGEIIGKAGDAEEAERQVRKLFSAAHKVMTGVAIVKLSEGIELVDSDITVVYPRKLTDEQIAEHIESGTWEGKAGAYAIKENGDEFVERIEGSMTNVMGLPMELLGRMLGRFGA